MKSKKIIAILLYAVYALGLVLAISFGTSVADEIIADMKDAFSKKNIDDVTVDIATDTELLAGKYYYPEYTAHGKFRGGAGLEYESLDPDYLVVSGSGKLYANTTFEGEKIDLRVRVTSEYDDDFEKVFTFRFVKKYPDDFSVSYSVMGSGKNTSVLHVGVPVFVYSEIAPGDEYNVTDHTIEYDERYFLRGDDGYIIPTRPTEDAETLTVAIQYKSGARAESEGFVIIDCTQPTEYDAIYLNGVPAEEFVGKRNEPIEITLYNDGELIATDYALSFGVKGDAKRDGEGGIRFTNVGDKSMTLKLPNGYAKTVEFGIENKLLLPTLKDETVRDTHIIHVMTSDMPTFHFDFDGAVGYDTVTYKYDATMTWVKASTRTFTLIPQTGGTTTITLVVDDGYRRIEDTYTVIIKEDIRPLAYISHHVTQFVTKVLGHLMMFSVLAYFAMNMFRYFSISDKRISFLLYTLTALPIAALTEIMQIFLPGRSPRFVDVVIDMAGFYLGTGIAILVIWGVRKCRSRYSIDDDDEEVSDVDT